MYALREEGDDSMGETYFNVKLFLSTPFARRATWGHAACLFERLQFLSTPSARRATPITHNPATQPLISIHALREEGDDPKNKKGRCRPISIHALREEGDVSVVVAKHHHAAFLSTPSARRATGSSDSFFTAPLHFYPRPPRGGRRIFSSDFQARKGISIHALREEGDQLS